MTIYSKLPAHGTMQLIEWKYANDPGKHVWTYNFKDENGNVVNGKGYASPN